MKRLVTILVLAGALAGPAAASATVQELGSKGDPVKGSCPAQPCSVMTKMTAYQGRAGSVKNPYVVRRAGYIVAFTVALGNPNSTQASFFENGFGSPSEVRLSILRKGKKRKSRLDHRLMAQSKLYKLDDFFGSSPTFVLSHPLRVRKNYIVALTTPTWAPVLTEGLTKSNWWRTSRPKKSCSDKDQQAAQDKTRSVKVFGCTYFKERLAYTATYVPDPKPTTKKKTGK